MWTLFDFSSLYSYCQIGQTVPFARLHHEFKIRQRSPATNSFVAGVEMKIKRVVLTAAILGGLGSLAYAQRPSATCPVHDVLGHPTGAPIDAKGQCEYEHSIGDGGNSIHYFRASCYY
jgi:hypothetical protein